MKVAVNLKTANSFKSWQISRKKKLSLRNFIISSKFGENRKKIFETKFYLLKFTNFTILIKARLWRHSLMPDEKKIRLTLVFIFRCPAHPHIHSKAEIRIYFHRLWHKSKTFLAGLWNLQNLSVDIALSWIETARRDIDRWTIKHLTTGAGLQAIEWRV